MRRATRAWIWAGLVAVLAGLTWAWLDGESRSTRRLRVALRAELAREGVPVCLAGSDLNTTEQVRRFYERRAYRPAWVRDRGPSEEASRMARILDAAGEHGLDPEEYGRARIQELLSLTSRDALRRRPHPGVQAELEIRLTACALRYASDVRNGRAAPHPAPRDLSALPEDGDPVIVLTDALATGRVGEEIRDLHPSAPAYAALEDALDRYRLLAARDGGRCVGAGPALALGARGARVERLRQRLVAHGDLAAACASGSLFDAPVHEGLRRFQARHGLEVTGRAGPADVAALDLPVAERARQIELNLERWRWLPEHLGERHLLVNLAEGTLHIEERGRTRAVMRARVGREYVGAPVLSDRVTDVVFAPPWKIPAWMAVGEMLPRLSQDPGYLERNRIAAWGEQASVLTTAPWNALVERVARLGLTQEPGPWNPMGRVKLECASSEDVYLNDGAADWEPGPAELASHAAALPERDGCIRVERPEKLAAWILEGAAGWDPDRVRSAMGDGRTLAVRVQDPVPVHIVYWTAWVDEEGEVHFRDDVWGVDAALDRALRRLAGTGRDRAAPTSGLAAREATAGRAVQALSSLPAQGMARGTALWPLGR